MLSDEGLSAFFLNYAMMMKAGIQTAEGAALLLEGAPDPGEAAWLAEVSQALSQGASLSDALAQTGRFPPFALRMLSIGNATGRMEVVLTALAQHYKREAALKAAIQNAVTYPVTMLAVICVILIVLIWQVLPIFASVYQDLGGDIPPVAQLFLTLGDVSKYLAMAFAGICLLMILSGLLLGFSEKGRSQLSQLADRLFFHNKLFPTVRRSRFASVMGLMLSSGLTMEESLDYAQELLGSASFTAQLEQCRTLMDQGANFTQATSQAGIFLGVPAGILAAGFRSGSMEQAFNEMADRYQDEADTMLNRVLTRSQPAFVVVLSLAVGLVLLSVMLPLLGMLNSIGL